MKPSAISLVVLSSVAAMTTLGDARFDLVILPSSAGSGDACGLAVNSRGVVVGEMIRAGETYPVAVAWTAGNTNPPVILTGTGQSFSRSYGINDSGVIVGQSDQLGFKAFRVVPPGGAAIISELGGTVSVAYGITPGGYVVGSRTSSQSPGGKPFIIRNGVFTQLPILGGFSGSVNAISPNGMMAGSSDISSAGGFAAVRWINDQPVQLPGGNSVNNAYGVNDDGWAVGYVSGPPFTTYEASVWTTPTSRTYLGTLSAGSPFNYAYAINGRRQIVGMSAGRAFLWEGGVMRDLNALIAAGSGWILTEARAIGENGLITGRATQGSVSRAFFLRTHCHADFNADGTVDFFDYLDFVDALSGTLAIADFNGDSSIDFFDYLDFVDMFSSGC